MANCIKRGEKMKEFRNELIDGIVEVSLETGTPLSKCIEIAIEMLKKEKRKNYKNYLEKEMFRGGR